MHRAHPARETVVVAVAWLLPVALSTSSARNRWWRDKSCLAVPLSAIVNAALAPAATLTVVCPSATVRLRRVAALIAMIRCPLRCSTALSASVPLQRSPAAPTQATVTLPFEPFTLTAAIVAVAGCAPPPPLEPPPPPEEGLALTAIESAAVDGAGDRGGGHEEHARAACSLP